MKNLQTWSTEGGRFFFTIMIFSKVFIQARSYRADAENTEQDCDFINVRN